MDYIARNFLISMMLSMGLDIFPEAQCSLWQENPKPRMEVSAEQHRQNSRQFMGNGSAPDYFRLLERDGTSLLVGARNMVYNISLLNLRENQRLEWYSSDQDVRTCTMKGKSDEECQNYIRVLTKRPEKQLLVCGTNAYSPKCRVVSMEEGNFVVKNEMSGIGSCPFDPRHNSTAVQVGEELFAGTVADFAGQIPSVFRTPTTLRTKDNAAYFNEPNFVGSLANGDYVYFFFRESAVEYTNCGKAIYSRVARVCKNDKGPNSRRRESWWTSFFKSRLNCSMPGEYPFYFDEIQSVSGLVSGNYNGQQSQVFYGVFNTPANSISGSAVCVFSFNDVDKAFNGRFKEQRMYNYNWLPVSNANVPEPRPGQCVNDSQTLPDQALNFVYSHTLMDETVPPMYGRPLLVYTSMAARYTTVAVAPQVRTVDDRAYDVLFVGTDDGRVIKSINLDSDNNDATQPLIIEEIDVLRGQPVTNLLVADDQLIVVFQSEIHSLKLQRCHLAQTCSECVRLRDPHCAWVSDKCTTPDWDSGNVLRHKTGQPIQNVKTGEDSRCPLDAAPYSPVSNYAPDSGVNCRPCITQCPACTLNPHLQKTDNGLAGREPKHGHHKPEDNEVPEYQTANVDMGNVYREETLAVAVVITLLLSLVVGFVIGYQVSRYRNSAFKETNLSEASDYSYSHRPGVDSRPTDYRTEPIYAPPNEYAPPTKAINVVLNMQRNTLKNLATTTPTLDSKPHPPSKKVYL